MGGNHHLAADYLISTGVLPGGVSNPTGAGFCKNYRFKECALDLSTQVSGAPPLCTDADLDVSNYRTNCSNICDDGSNPTVAPFKIVSKVVLTSLAQMVSALDISQKIIIQQMIVYEDLFNVKSTDIYTYTYGRHLGMVTVAIYGYLTDTATAQDYWIVRMPFGSNFGGDGGYIKIYKGGNVAGIESPGTAFYLNV